jgi:phage shock protein A
MEQLKRTTDKLISTIYEYQKYIKLNKQFIRELEDEGSDTSKLRREVAELERKIEELKIMAGFSF